MNRYSLRVSNQSDLEECAGWIQDGIPTSSTWRLPPIGQDALFLPKQIATCDVNLSVFNDNVHVGNVSLFDVDLKCRSCDVSIILRQDSDFKSIVSLIAKHCFKTLGLNRIQLQTFLNSPLSNVCEGINLHLDAILKEHGFEDGIFKHVQVWSLISKEFDERLSDEL